MKNFRFSLFIAFFALLLTASCKKDEAVVTLNFHADFDGAAIDQAKSYQMGTNSVQFTRFNYYVSDLILVKDDNTEVVLSEVEYINFTGQSDATSLMEPVALSFTVPNGNYKQLKIGYGVKPTLNAKKPADFAAKHPLAANLSEYWDDWDSYIFMKIEGRATGDQGDFNLVYHCGSDPVYRTGTKTISLNMGGKSTALDLHFDLKTMFFASGEWYDIFASPRTSDDLGNVKVAVDLMERIDQATAVK